MLRAAWLLLCVALTPAVALSQTPPDEPRIIVVPVPSDSPPVPDAGQPIAVPPPVPPPEPIVEPPVPPPLPPPSDVPAAPQSLEPTVPIDPNLDPASIQSPPSAMLDGHPREGSFLSGPGSVAFLMHHTIMGSTGALATQMIPRIFRNVQEKTARPTCTMTEPKCFDPTDPEARVAYLVSGLIGAAAGFTTAAFWQFYNWMGSNTAVFGIINSIIGGFFGIGLANTITTDPTPIAYTGLVGALGGAWLTAILGGGDMTSSKGLLITSGAGWAAIYTALILGIVASTGGSLNLQGGFDAIMIMPAVGAVAMAIAGLKFNPSSDQIIRADVFGGGVGLAVWVIAALLSPGNDTCRTFGCGVRSPIPYVLSALTAAGAKVIVSILWADTVNVPAATTPTSSIYRDPELDRPYRRVWW